MSSKVKNEKKKVEKQKYVKWIPEGRERTLKEYADSNIGLNECWRKYKIPKLTFLRNFKGTVKRGRSNIGVNGKEATHFNTGLPIFIISTFCEWIFVFLLMNRSINRFTFSCRRRIRKTFTIPWQDLPCTIWWKRLFYSPKKKPVK